jgi:hypothetical protein
MALVSGSISAFLAPDLREVYIETGKERAKEYPTIVNTPTMEWNPITDRNVSGMGTMPIKYEGTQFTLGDIIMGTTKTYTAVSYGLGVEITYEAWRDELYGVLAEMVRCLSRSSNYRLEVDAHSPYNNAFSTSYTGFTASTALCSLAQTQLNGTVWANRPNPDTGFSIAAIQDSILRFESMTDDRGLPRVMTPVLALVTPADKWSAREILGSSGKPYSSDNEMNALIQEDLTWMVNHYLTSGYWFLTAAKGIHDINFFVRDMPIFDMFDDPLTKNGICTCYQAHTAGYGTPRGIDGSYVS